MKLPDFVIQIVIYSNFHLTYYQRCVTVCYHGHSATCGLCVEEILDTFGTLFYVIRVHQNWATKIPILG